MGRMLRFKNFDELPPGLRASVRDTFAKKGVIARGESRPAAMEEKPRKKKLPSSALVLYLQLLKAGVTPPIREYHFDQQERDGRGWAFDLAWPSLMFACEIDGMVHRIKGRYKADIPRQQAAFMAGWRVLRVSPTDVESGRALELIRQAIGMMEGEGLTPLQRVFRRMELAQVEPVDPT